MYGMYRRICCAQGNRHMRLQGLCFDVSMLVVISLIIAVTLDKIDE